MKTKLIALLAAVVMVLSLTACHKAEDMDVTTKAAKTTVATEVSTEAEKTTEETKSSTEKQEQKTVSTTVIKNQISLVGTWDDRYSQRATMEIRGGRNQTYSIHVHWGSSAMESEDWSMTGTFSDSTGELIYKDCIRMTLTFSEDGTETDEVHYKNGTGKFLYKNGELYWQDNNDDYVNDCVFAR
ncbi:MAG: hypothetical protein IJ720_03600 [Clostridia bacterium]|nr:hypothetical protein [Clostridia bacterium]MBQ8469410.1 hypothetical protein [Clostridia bacterium]MBR1704433.1 hypothetical protein [Clostridia bacterium]